jgi:hypothetical protein
VTENAERVRRQQAGTIGIDADNNPITGFSEVGGDDGELGKHELVHGPSVRTL